MGDARGVSEPPAATPESAPARAAPVSVAPGPDARVKRPRGPGYPRPGVGAAGLRRRPARVCPPAQRSRQPPRRACARPARQRRRAEEDRHRREVQEGESPRVAVDASRLGVGQLLLPGEGIRSVRIEILGRPEGRRARRDHAGRRRRHRRSRRGGRRRRRRQGAQGAAGETPRPVQDAGQGRRQRGDRSRDPGDPARARRGDGHRLVEVVPKGQVPGAGRGAGHRQAGRVRVPPGKAGNQRNVHPQPRRRQEEREARVDRPHPPLRQVRGRLHRRLVQRAGHRADGQAQREDVVRALRRSRLPDRPDGGVRRARQEGQVQGRPLQGGP